MAQAKHEHVMKSEADIDQIMETIPADWRYRWCGGIEPGGGGCACLGCVQIGNRYAMVREATGSCFVGDPEHIDERRIPAEIFRRLKITREEWENWVRRHPAR